MMNTVGQTMVYLTLKVDATQNASIFPKKKSHKFTMRFAFGTVLENVVIDEETRVPDYDDTSLTENTRAAYPIEAIDNIVHAKHCWSSETIIFLTADAFGVLPPISKLTKEQAMYHFLSRLHKQACWYRARCNITRSDILNLLRCTILAASCSYVMQKCSVKKSMNIMYNVFLVNTGWTGGEYGVGTNETCLYTCDGSSCT